MARKAKTGATSKGRVTERPSATLGLEAKLWAAADALRNNMDAAEYKHVVLGLIFLKYISDAFEAKHAELEAQKPQGANPEDPDEFRAASIFWVPKEARWTHLKANAPQPTIGTLVDDAMSAIERDNPSLKAVFRRGGAVGRRIAFLSLALTTSAVPAVAQRGVEPTTALELYAGFSGGTRIWRLDQPLCVWQPVPGGGYQCEQSGGALVNDTLHLARVAGVGLAAGIALTTFRGSHLGIRVAFDYHNEPVIETCAPANSFQPDSQQKNHQVCDSFAARSASLHFTTLSAGVLWREFARHPLSPYARIGAGATVRSGETLAASGTFSDGGLQVNRDLVKDSSGLAVRPSLEVAIGIVSGLGHGDRFRAEVSSMWTPLARFTGSGGQTVAGLPEAAPHRERWFRTITIALGLNVVLDRSPGRRY